MRERKKSCRMTCSVALKIRRERTTQDKIIVQTEQAFSALSRASTMKSETEYKTHHRYIASMKSLSHLTAPNTKMIHEKNRTVLIENRKKNTSTTWSQTIDVITLIHLYHEWTTTRSKKITTTISVRFCCCCLFFLLVVFILNLSHVFSIRQKLITYTRYLNSVSFFKSRCNSTNRSIFPSVVIQWTVAAELQLAVHSNSK